MAKTIRVMVAEDFPLLREDFCDVVSAQSDMEVVGSAASGEEIASLADTVPCDVILMDAFSISIRINIYRSCFLTSDNTTGAYGRNRWFTALPCDLGTIRSRGL